jgi:hypothetical protein
MVHEHIACWVVNVGDRVERLVGGGEQSGLSSWVSQEVSQIYASTKKGPKVRLTVTQSVPNVIGLGTFTS